MTTQRDFIESNLNIEDDDKVLKKSFKAIFDERLRNRYVQILKDKHNIPPSKGAANSVAKKLKMFVLFAACFAALYTAYNYVFHSKDKIQVIADNALFQEVYPYMDTTRGEAVASDTRNRAIKAYSAADYKEAIIQFNKLDELTETDFFYHGLSLLYDGQFSKAEEKFDVLFAVENFEYREELKWYASLNYIKLNQTKEAKSLLTSISNWKQKEIQQLLKYM